VHGGLLRWAVVCICAAQDGFNALLNAAQYGHTATVEVLLAKGADVNSQDLVCAEPFRTLCTLRAALVVTKRVPHGGPTDSCGLECWCGAVWEERALQGGAGRTHSDGDYADDNGRGGQCPKPGACTVCAR
jgi:hypothetical protein